MEEYTMKKNQEFWTPEILFNMDVVYSLPNLTEGTCFPLKEGLSMILPLLPQKISISFQYHIDSGQWK